MGNSPCGSDMYHGSHYDKCCIDNKSGVIGGVAAMLIITLSIPSRETVLFVLSSFGDFYGFCAILVNYDGPILQFHTEKIK